MQEIYFLKNKLNKISLYYIEVILSNDIFRKDK